MEMVGFMKGFGSECGLMQVISCNYLLEVIIAYEE